MLFWGEELETKLLNAFEFLLQFLACLPFLIELLGQSADQYCRGCAGDIWLSAAHTTCNYCDEIFLLGINLRRVLRTAIILIISLRVLHIIERVYLIVELFLLCCLFILFRYNFWMLDCCRTILGSISIFSLSITCILGLFSSCAMGIFHWTSRSSKHSWSEALGNTSSATSITEYWWLSIVVVSKCISKLIIKKH